MFYDVLMLEALFEIILFGIGSVVLRVLSAGKVYTEIDVHKVEKFPWHGFKKQPDGRYCVSNDMVSFLGIITVAVIGIVIWRVIVLL